MEGASRYLDKKDSFALNNNANELWLLANSGDLFKADLTQDIQDTVAFTKQAHIQLSDPIWRQQSKS